MNETAEPLPDPKPYVAPRSGLRQAKRAWLPAILSILFGALASVGLLFAVLNWPMPDRDDNVTVYLAALALLLLGTTVVSAKMRQWWLAPCFVVGALPGTLLTVLLHNMRC